MQAISARCGGRDPVPQMRIETLPTGHCRHHLFAEQLDRAQDFRKLDVAEHHLRHEIVAAVRRDLGFDKAPHRRGAHTSPYVSKGSGAGVGLRITGELAIELSRQRPAIVDVQFRSGGGQRGV